MILTLGQGRSPGRGPGSLHFLHRVGRPPSFSCQWHRNHNCTEAKESEQSSKWNASYWGHYFDPVHILSHTVSYLTSQPDSVVRSLTDIKIVDPISTPLLLPWPTSLSCPFSHHCVICKGLRRWRVFFSNLHARVLKQLQRQLSGAGIDSRKTQTWKKNQNTSLFKQSAATSIRNYTFSTSFSAQCDFLSWCTWCELTHVLHQKCH